MKLLFTIDPGIAGTGWAYFIHGKLRYHGVLTPPTKLTWQEKSNWIVRQLKNLAPKNGVVCVEQPALFGGAKGSVTASSGSLVKLTLLVGRIMQELNAEGIEVREWKGQLPKAVVEKRIRVILPNCTAKSHDWDAIGIGLYKLGVF
jgi:hypothetical protein